MGEFGDILKNCGSNKEIDMEIRHLHRWIPTTLMTDLEIFARPYREKLKKSNLYKKDDK